MESVPYQINFFDQFDSLSILIGLGKNILMAVVAFLLTVTCYRLNFRMYFN